MDNIKIDETELTSTCSFSALIVLAGLFYGRRSQFLTTILNEITGEPKRLLNITLWQSLDQG